MIELHPGQIAAALVILPCVDLDETVEYFVGTLGFRLASISPADDPRTAVLEGHGTRVELRRDHTGDPGHLRLLYREPVVGGQRTVIAPNGTRIELSPADPPVVLPSSRPSFTVNRAREAAAWVVGRAGMRYRDLLPDREGGRFIASHIAIPDGGPVPDYVHFHRIRFQVIFCHRGWVRVVYEDQGPPFTLREGDCVLQPPEIRHRVLEASPGLEVVEITSPAEHETLVEHDLSLPTGALRPERDFGGQRFVHHVAATASWRRWRMEGFEARDTGIAAATGGLADVRVVRPVSSSDRSEPDRGAVGVHDGELLFLFVLDGGLTLQIGPDSWTLAVGDAVTIPAGLRHELTGTTGDLQLLEVMLPAVQETNRG